MACGCPHGAAMNHSVVLKAHKSNFLSVRSLPCRLRSSVQQQQQRKLDVRMTGVARSATIPHLGLVSQSHGATYACRSRRAGDRSSRRPRLRVQVDDFEMEDEVDFEGDRPELGEDDEEDMRDYETEYESPIGYTMMQGESESFVNTEGEEEETVVDWKINEEEFHKLSLLSCDFFIRKFPDPDNDVYDFREMYVTPPDTDIYSIPKVVGTMPKKPVRCMSSKYEYIHTSEPPVDEPRAPLYKTEMECMKIFLIRHLKDRRTDHEKFILDFEEIYVIDAKSKSITRVEVSVEVPGGKTRDRSQEILIVRDDGNTFRIIPESEQKSPDEVIGGLQWERTREAMENYLRGFRDYETSNWF